MAVSVSPTRQEFGDLPHSDESEEDVVVKSKYTYETPLEPEGDYDEDTVALTPLEDHIDNPPPNGGLALGMRGSNMGAGSSLEGAVEAASDPSSDSRRHPLSLGWSLSVGLSAVFIFKGRAVSVSVEDDQLRWQLVRSRDQQRSEKSSVCVNIFDLCVLFFAVKRASVSLADIFAVTLKTTNRRYPERANSFTVHALRSVS